MQRTEPAGNRAPPCAREKCVRLCLSRRKERAEIRFMNTMTGFFGEIYRCCLWRLGSMDSMGIEIRRLKLPKGRVARIDKGTHREISVKQGTIWLTATPAAGDTVLKNGAEVILSEGFPWVLEAIEDAEVEMRIA